MAVKTWSNSAGGNWNVAGNWVGGVPGNTDDALITSPPNGIYVVTISDNESLTNLTLNDTTATIQITQTGALLPSGQFNFNAGTLELDGALTGATVINRGTAGTPTVFNVSSGILNGVVWQGALTVANSGVTLNIINGLVVTDVAGTGAGTITLAAADVLNFANVETLDGVSSAQPLIVNLVDRNEFDAASGTTTFLGPNSSLNYAASSGNFYFGGSGTIDSQGTINFAGNTNFQVGTFTNDTTGVLSVASSRFNTSSFKNAGTYNQNGAFSGNVFNGTSLGAGFTNTGVMNLTSAVGSLNLFNSNEVLSNTGTINIGVSSSFAVTGGLGIVGNGRINLASFGTLDIQNDASGTIDFQATRGILKLENAGTLGASVFGFRKATLGNAVDQIDIVNGGTFVSATFSGTSSGGALTIVTQNGTTNLTNVVNLIGADYTAATFGHNTDGAAGTFITTTNTACFAAGTRILTERGEVAVEALREGDIAITAYGETRAQQPIRWIGHTRIDLDRHPTPQTVGPIRVAAGAFGANMPHADLLLSPDHSMFVAGGGDAPGFLVPVHYLVNGGSIRREAVGGIVTYYHVELDQHDVLLANGLPAESYLDTGNRADFANGGGVQTLFPEFRERAWSALACAEMVTDGARLDATRAMLAEQAARLGLARTADPQVAVEANGRAVAVSRTATGWSCIVPAGSDTVRVASLSFIPDELDRAAGDARRLGLCLRAVRLGGHDLALDGAAMASGFHRPEAGLRWTDGAATMRFAPLAEDALFEADAVELGALYWTSRPAEHADRRAA